MDVIILKRNIALAKLGIGDLNFRERRVYNFLKDNLLDLNCYKTKDYPSVYFFGKSETSIVLEYHFIVDYLCINYNDIWSYFVYMNIEEEDIKSLIRWWIKDTINIHTTNITYGGNILEHLLFSGGLEKI